MKIHIYNSRNKVRFVEAGKMKSVDVPDRIFSLRYMVTKQIGAFPVVVFTGLGVGFCASYIAYMMLRKPDMAIKLGRWQNNPPYMDIQPHENRKVFTFNHKYVSNPEVENLRKDLYSHPEYTKY